MANSALRVFIVAGEASGAAIGSRLMASLRTLSSSPVEFAGIGGPLMEKQGLASEFQMDDISVMGLVELLPHVFRLREFSTVSPEAYARLGRARPPTVHYVAPSFWAWKGGEDNLKNLVEIVDLMLCILPFEEAVCQAHGLSATFVGHPVLEDALSAPNKFYNGSKWQINGDGDYFRRHFNISPEATVLSVLPGSRVQEVKRMLPLFESAIQFLANSVANLSVVVPTVQSQPVLQTTEAFLKKWDFPVVVLPGASDSDKYNAFAVRF